MKYSDRLKDPRWQKKRLKILERDEWTCQKCGSKDTTLSVHHFHYSKDFEPWEYHDESLITLCNDCHNEEFEFKRESEQILIETLTSYGRCFSNSVHNLACILGSELKGNNIAEFIEALSHACRKNDLANTIIAEYRAWKQAHN